MLLKLRRQRAFAPFGKQLGGKGAGAIDYGREYVDCGKRSDPITDR
jgi:hypothetical protein